MMTGLSLLGYLAMMGAIWVWYRRETRKKR